MFSEVTLFQLQHTVAVSATIWVYIYNVKFGKTASPLFQSNVENELIDFMQLGYWLIYLTKIAKETMIFIYFVLSVVANKLVSTG